MTEGKKERKKRGKKEGVEGGLVGYQKKRRWGGNVRMGVDMFLKRVLGDQNSLGVGS